MLLLVVVAVLAAAAGECYIRSAAASPLLWFGALTHNSVAFRVASRLAGASFAIYNNNNDAVYNTTLAIDAANQQQHPVPIALTIDQGLAPSTAYTFAVSDYSGSSSSASNNNIIVASGSFRTRATPHTAQNLTFAFGSCQKFADAPDVWRQLRRRHNTNGDDNGEQQQGGLDLFIHMGDLFYADIASNDTAAFHTEYTRLFEDDAVSAFGDFARHVPFAYMFDDHDFGPNDADAGSASRVAAQRSYRAHVPHHALNNTNGAIYHAFTEGRVRFIVSDVRSESVDDSGNGGGGIMSQRQLNWLFAELRDAARFAMLVWVNSKPWIGARNADKSLWSGHWRQRRLIANHIAAHNVTNLVMISGDAHMLAFDDGTHSNYADVHGDDDDDALSGFPVMQSAPLFNLGSSKGGPYSHGCHGYRLYPTQQYSTVRIIDYGGIDDDVCFEFKAYRVDCSLLAPRGESCELLSYSACAPFGRRGNQGGGHGSCSIGWFPWWVWMLFVASFALMIGTLSVVICCGNARCMWCCGPCCCCNCSAACAPRQRCVQRCLDWKRVRARTWAPVDTVLFVLGYAFCFVFAVLIVAAVSAPWLLWLGFLLLFVAGLFFLVLLLAALRYRCSCKTICARHCAPLLCCCCGRSVHWCCRSSGGTSGSISISTMRSDDDDGVHVPVRQRQPPQVGMTTVTATATATATSITTATDQEERKHAFD
jgi:hypothetical protein